MEKYRRFKMGFLFYGSLGATLSSIGGLVACYFLKDVIPIFATGFFSVCLLIGSISTLILIVTKNLNEITEHIIFGYNLWLFYDKPCCNRGHWNIAHCVLPSGKVMNDIGAALIIPLGGWFNRPRLWFKKGDADGNNINHHWSIKDFGEREAWFSNLMDGNYSVVFLTLRWRDQSQIVLTVPEALNYLEFMHEQEACPATPPESLISDTISGFRTSTADVQRHVILGKKLAKEKDEIQKRCDALNNLLRQTAERLNATKRFVKSKEGAALREWLEAELRELGSEPKDKDAAA